MLQALKLENAPKPAKVRTERGSAGDPADALFAGLMAQSALASAAPPKSAATSTPSMPRRDWAKSKDPSSGRTPLLETPAAPEVRASSPTASTGLKEASTVSDSAKAAVQTSPPEKTESARGTSLESVSKSILCDEASAAQQVPAGAGATMVQQTPPDGQPLPAEAPQSALPQQPAFMNPGPAIVSLQWPKPIILGSGSSPAEGIPAHEPSLPEFRQILETPSSTPPSTATPNFTDLSPAAVSPQGLKPISLLDPGSNPAEATLSGDSGLFEFPKPADTTGATPSNPGKPALTEGSQTTVIPQGLNQTRVQGPETNAAEGLLAKDPALLELPKPLEPTSAAPPNIVKPALADTFQATAIPQELKAATLDPKAALAKETPILDPTQSGLPQTQEVSSAASSSFAKIPLGEQLPIAKTEIQSLKLKPEMAKPSQAEPPESVDVRPQGTPTEPKPARSQGQVGDKELPAPSSKAREEAAQAGLLGPDDSAQTQKAHSSPSEVLALPIGAGYKTASGSPHAETTAMRPNPVFTQVEGSIRWILQNKTQGAELQLHPESLGRMIIQLRVEGQEVHARLWASEASSLPILREHKAFLEASLKEQGLSLGSFDLHSGARHEQAQTTSQERAMGNPSGYPPAELKQEMPNRDPHRGLLASEDPHQIEVYA